MKVGQHLLLENAIEHLKSVGITIIQIGEKLGIDKQTIINIRRLKNLQRQDELLEQIKQNYADFFPEEQTETKREKILQIDKEKFLLEQIDFYKKETARLREENAALLNKLLEKQ